MGELRALTERELAPRPDFPVARIADWHSAPTIWHATDLLSAAIVSSRPEVAFDAARFLLDTRRGVSPAALDLAHRVLDPSITPLQDELEGDWTATVRAVRSLVRRDPRSALQWTDLGLAHTVLGNRKGALRSITVALSLAPENRFVLRSAVRCFLHWGELDRAHSILRASDAVLTDPWLLSAEIAISSARQRRSLLFTEARRMLRSGSFSSHDTSELACGLGSAEFEAGSRRHAFLLLARAMTHPTENAVAQAQWIFRKEHKALPAFESIRVPRLYEASAQESYVKGDWSDALRYARQWLADQPFSSRPADLASYASALLGQYAEAVNLLRSARVSNSNDQMILNNLAYFSVLAGDMAGGQRWMRMVDWSDLNENERPVVAATAGLFKFRSGDIEGGRVAYEQSIRDGLRLRDARLEAVALMNLSREERLAGNPVRAQERLREARSAARRTQAEDVKTLLARLESHLD